MSYTIDLRPYGTKTIFLVQDLRLDLAKVNELKIGVYTSLGHGEIKFITKEQMNGFVAQYTGVMENGL